MALIRSSGARDLRVDFFRGLALWWIYTDHIPGDVMGNFSLHSVALCDAAEVFVLLAGFGAGKAYASVMDRDGYLYGAAEAVKRAWTLYIAHIFLFVVYAAQVSYGATALNRLNYLDESRLNVLADQPYEALMQALTLRYQPSLLNILPLYIVLLVMFAVAMPLLRRPKLLAALSLALYVGVRAAGFNLPSWTDDGWFLNPFTWQVLFVIGAILAYAPPRRVPAPPVLLDVLSWAVLAGGLVVIFGIWQHPRFRRDAALAVDPRAAGDRQDQSRPAAAVLHPGAAVAHRPPGSGRCALAAIPAGCPAGADGAAFLAGVLFQHLHRLFRPDDAGEQRCGADANSGQSRRAGGDGRRGRPGRLVWRARPFPLAGALAGRGAHCYARVP